MSDIKSHFTYIWMLTEEKWWAVNNVISNSWSSDYLAASPENKKTHQPTQARQRNILLMLFMCFQHSLMRTWAVKHTVFTAWSVANETFRPPYAVMHRIWWMNFNHSFNNISIEIHAPGDTFLELILLSFSVQKNKKKKSLVGSLTADLLCYVAHKDRKRTQRAQRKQQQWLLSQFIWQWHIETIVEGMCLSTVLVVFPSFVVLHDKEPVPDISPDGSAAPVGRSDEVWLRCARLFLNVNRGIHDHWVASVSVCGSASVSFSTRGPKIFTDTHAHT